MTNDTQDTASKKPTHIAYLVKKNGGQSFWHPVGAAWAHEDGKGFSLRLDALPLDGRIELRRPKPKE